jgi:diguanylate cyclase (GGDEF)-like protein
VSNGKNFDERARIALWYAIEEAFGSVLYDAMAEPYWSDEIEELEECLRKRLRLLELADERHVPEVVKAFVVEKASPDQLFAVAEEALAVGLRARMDRSQLRKLIANLEQALKEGGVQAHFDESGKLIEGAGVDTAPKAITDLPGQAQFKSDLAVQTRQIALIFVDLDNFKSVNDTKGHQTGDACLAKVVEVIGESIAGKGKLYRYGGDEFAVILQNATVDEAVATSERIRRAIESARPGGGEIEVTGSIGVAASDQRGLYDAENLLNAADQATYASKNNGKNRVTKWQQDVDAEMRGPSAQRQRTASNG